MKLVAIIKRIHTFEIPNSNKMETTKKITLSTVKSFIKKNDNLFIDLRSSFSGMSDMVEQINNGFVKAEKSDRNQSNTLGIDGAWFVGQSRDYFTSFESVDFTGIKVSNACGSFVLAIKK